MTLPNDAEGICGANRRQGEPGDVCKLPKGWGTPHVGVGRCKLHGGNTPDQIKHANRTKTEALVKTYGGPVDAPANEVLSDLIATTYGHVTWLSAAITSSASIGEVDRFLIERYDAERLLLARMTKDALGVGIAERQVKLAENQGRQLAGVLRDVIGDVFRLLGEAGVEVDVLVRIQREQVPGVVRHRLSEVMEATA